MQAYIEEAITKLNAEIAAKRADGKLEWVEVLELVYAAIADAFVLAARLANLSPQDRRDAVKTAILTIYDRVLAPLNLTGVPIVEGIVDSALRRVVDVGADALVRFIFGAMASELAALAAKGDE